MHDSKKGGRNDDNKSYGDLKSGNYWEIDSSGAAVLIGISLIAKIGVTLYTGIPVF